MIPGFLQAKMRGQSQTLIEMIMSGKVFQIREEDWSELLEKFKPIIVARSEEPYVPMPDVPGRPYNVCKVYCSHIIDGPQTSNRPFFICGPEGEAPYYLIGTSTAAHAIQHLGDWLKEQSQPEGE